MSRELTTKVVKLDVKTILDNYLDKRFWSKNWEVYRGEQFSIYVRVDTIDIRFNCIDMRVHFNSEGCYKLRKTTKKTWLYGWDWTTFHIPIRADYTQTKFEHDLVCNCERLIKSIEDRLIRQYSEYAQANDLDNTELEKNRDALNSYLDEQGVTAQDIRDAYIEQNLGELPKSEYATQVLTSMSKTVIPYEYLRCAGFIFSDREAFDKYATGFSKVRKSMRGMLWRKAKEIESDDYVEKLKEALNE